jgi:hypothetical protein
MFAVSNENRTSQLTERAATFDPIGGIKHTLLAASQPFRSKDTPCQFRLLAKRKNRGALGSV